MCLHNSVHRPALPPSITPQGYKEGHGGVLVRHRDMPIQILPFLAVGTWEAVKDTQLLVSLKISALMNCSSLDFSAPIGLVYGHCAFDDPNTSLSLQRQKAMDLISSTRQVSFFDSFFERENDRVCVGVWAGMWQGGCLFMQNLTSRSTESA